MSLEQAPPPEDPSAGYKPDPLGSKNSRRWDGEKWTQDVKAPEGSGMSSSMKWLLGIGCSVVVLIGIGAAIGEEEPSDEPAKEKQSTVADDTTPEPAPAVEKTEPSAAATAEVEAEAEVPAEPVEKPEPVDPAEEVSAALEDVPDSIYDVNVKDVTMLAGTMMVDLETPEGGLEGASTYDMNNMVAAVYRRIFTETDLEKPVLISFSGGLVNSKTGADLPDAVTGVYVIQKPEIRQIDWDDEDTVIYGGIDWSLYRTMLHPAIKEDD